MINLFFDNFWSNEIICLLDLEFKFFVGLFVIIIGVFLVKVCVIIVCCFWLLLSLDVLWCLWFVNLILLISFNVCFLCFFLG